MKWTSSKKYPTQSKILEIRTEIGPAQLKICLSLQLTKSTWIESDRRTKPCSWKHTTKTSDPDSMGWIREPERENQVSRNDWRRNREGERTGEAHRNEGWKWVQFQDQWLGFSWTSAEKSRKTTNTRLCRSEKTTFLQLENKFQLCESIKNRLIRTKLISKISHRWNQQMSRNRQAVEKFWLLTQKKSAPQTQRRTMISSPPPSVKSTRAARQANFTHEGNTDYCNCHSASENNENGNMKASPPCESMLQEKNAKILTSRISKPPRQASKQSNATQQRAHPLPLAQRFLELINGRSLDADSQLQLEPKQFSKGSEELGCFKWCSGRMTK